MNQKLKVCLVILILLGAITIPVLAVSVWAFPDGDVRIESDNGVWHYYHHDTGQWETNDNDEDGRVDPLFVQPSVSDLISPLVSTNQASSPNFGTYLTGFSISSPVKSFQIATPTFSPKNLLSSFAKQNMQVY